MSLKGQYEAASGEWLNYQLFLPKAYDPAAEKEWPCILFLHGSGRRGTDIGLLDEYGLNGLAQRLDHFPFVVLTPQCPPDSSWIDHREAVLALLKETIRKNNVDATKVYVTGFSMGGSGAWDLAARSPETFAAAIPISGWFDPDQAERLKHMPIWNFHGEDDETVPLGKSDEMVAALREIGAPVKFTSYPGLGHAVMNITYDKPELFQWLLEHQSPRETGNRVLNEGDAEAEA